MGSSPGRCARSAMPRRSVSEARCVKTRRTAADATAMLGRMASARDDVGAPARARPRSPRSPRTLVLQAADGARLRRAAGADARLDVRRRPRRRVVRRRLPPRDLPAGGGHARRARPVPVARLGSDRRAELHLAADGGVLPRAADAAAARRGRRRDGRPRPRRLRRRALARRRPRLAGLRRRRALAAGRRGDARLAPDPAPLRPRGARVAHAARAVRARASRSESRSR